MKLKNKIDWAKLSDVCFLSALGLLVSVLAVSLTCLAFDDQRPLVVAVWAVLAAVCVSLVVFLAGALFEDLD